MEDFELKNKRLAEAVKDYYTWNGETNAVPVSIIHNKYSSATMLLVHFTDKNGNEMSSLMYGMSWKDGHYDISEFEACERAEEAEMIHGFENSEEYIMEVCDD